MPEWPFSGRPGIAWPGKFVLGHSGDSVPLAPDPSLDLDAALAGGASALGTLRVVEPAPLESALDGGATVSGLLRVVNPAATPTTPLILYDGIDITADVEFRTVELIAKARDDPGTAKFRVRTPTMEFITGKELTFDIGGERLWGGFITSVRYGYYFPAAVETRFAFIEAVDYNIFSQKRILYDKTTPTKVELTKFPPYTPDRQVIRYYIDNHTDLDLDDVNVVAGIEHVGTPSTDDQISGQAGWTLGQFLRHIRFHTGAIDYWDPDKRLIHTDVDRPNAPFGISDDPGPGEIGCRDLEIDFGAEALRNDALIWGVGQGVEGIPVDGPAPPVEGVDFDALVDEWIDRADLDTLNGRTFTNMTRETDGPGGNSCLEPTGFHQTYLTITGLIPDMRVTVNVKTHGRLSGGGTVFVVQTQNGGAFIPSEQQSWLETTKTVTIGDDGKLTLRGVWAPVIADLTITQEAWEQATELSNGVVFARTTDTSSGKLLSQIGRLLPTVWHQDTVERIADSYIYGSPQNLRGGKDDRVAVRCTIFTPGLRVADKVNVRSASFGFEDVIPVREMRITFPTQTDPQYDLILSHEIDDPWSTLEIFIPEFDWEPPDLGFDLPSLPRIIIPGGGGATGGSVPTCIGGEYIHILNDPDDELGVRIEMLPFGTTIGAPAPENHPLGAGYLMVDGNPETGNVSYTWQTAASIHWWSATPFYAYGARIIQGIGSPQPEKNRSGRLKMYQKVGGDWVLVGDSGDVYPPQTGGPGPQEISVTADLFFNGGASTEWLVESAQAFYRFPGVFEVAGNWVVNEAILTVGCVTVDTPLGEEWESDGEDTEIIESPTPEGEDAGYYYYSVKSSWEPGTLLVWIDGLLQDPSTYEENSVGRWIRFVSPVTGVLHVRYYTKR